MAKSADEDVLILAVTFLTVEVRGGRPYLCVSRESPGRNGQVHPFTLFVRIADEPYSRFRQELENGAIANGGELALCTKVMTEGDCKRRVVVDFLIPGDATANLDEEDDPIIKRAIAALGRDRRFREKYQPNLPKITT